MLQINNAATGQMCPFESLSMKQMQELYQTNVFGICKLTQEVVKNMKERRSGHIVFITSIGGVYSFPLCDFYVGTKFAIEGIAGSLAPVLRHFNVSVTCVEPGFMGTSFGSNIGKNKQGGGGGGVGGGGELDAVVDERTIAIRQSLFKNLASSHGTAQSAPEVAEVIRKCLLEEKPPGRVQTSESVKERVRVVLTDPTGDAVTDKLANSLNPQ